MDVRIRDESGFGLLELLIAMVILNVGLFAIVGVFNGATVAISRAASVSAATAVADKQMEIYRSLEGCAIWLDGTIATGSFPAKGSGSAYEADTKAYTSPGGAGPVAFFDKSLTPTDQGFLPWSTNATSTASGPWGRDIATSCTPKPGTTPPASATQAIQTVSGPDGASYWVYTYIILTQWTGGTVAAPTEGTWVKQVTVVVRDPRNEAKILARETSTFR